MERAPEPDSVDCHQAEIQIGYLSIGLWNKRHRGDISLSVLILYESQQLIFLVDNTTAPVVVKKGYKRYLRHFTASSPFRSSQKDVSCVLAFEVECHNVCGVDYSNPLCLPGRLVLESTSICRKEFPTDDSSQLGHSPPNDSAHLSAGPQWSAVLRSEGPKFRVGQAEEKLPPSRGASRTPTKRRGPETGVPSSRHASPVPRRRTTTDLPSRERHSRLSTVSRPASSDHSKRKRRESHDAYADTGTSRPYSDIQSRDLASAFDDCTTSIHGGTVVQPSAQYKYCTITINFDDPAVPTALKPLIEGDERLLKLYESGLPAWAIYAPQYGIWYRPWTRRVTYLLFVLLSCFSLVMGFYDLYKNVPFLDQFLRQYGSFPAAAIMQWLDEHLSFRLSILFAYLFGKSELAISILRYLGTFGAMCRESLQPLMSILRPAFDGWLSSCGEFAASVKLLGRPLTDALQLGLSITFGRPLRAVGSFLYVVLLPLIQLAAYLGTTLLVVPLTLVQISSNGFASFLISMRDLALGIGSVASSVWRTVSAGAHVTSQASASAQGVGSQVSWLYSAIRLEALEVVKTSFLKVVRALQTLARLCVHCGSNLARHRLTLQLRLRRQKHKAKARFQSCMPRWLVDIWRWMLASRDTDRAQTTIADAWLPEPKKLS